MQQYELEAWLGDDHGLNDDQISELLAQADEIEERCDGDQDEMREELVTAYRLMIEEPDTVVAELAERRVAASVAEANALAGLRQAATTLIGRGDATEAGFARQAGVDRMTVRKWLGKQ
ncbi:hypothetical protein [Streptomyces triticisoli]|uniref:hypothetical protein n=1 Tax=Streptomyces triticisoli TaxID=2182797 RepID=UPI000DD7C0F3|nr:hypothetical protein [Streptomyces triticisoli]